MDVMFQQLSQFNLLHTFRESCIVYYLITISNGRDVKSTSVPISVEPGVDSASKRDGGSGT